MMMKIVATNVVASQPPNRGPTGTPIARANYRVLEDPVCSCRVLFGHTMSSI